MNKLLSEKQLKFINESTKKINIAHGSVRSGKTVGTLFRFMHAVNECPDSKIWMIGHTSDTIYQNAVRLLLEAGENDPLGVFKPFITWHPGKRVLTFMNKTISTLGAKDEGAIGSIQGKTFSLCYCDEITLYPESVIDMIDTRLSNSYSQLFCSCNPSHPTHKIKQWIDKAQEKDSSYYEISFTLDDNPYVDESYKKRIRESLSGLFYKRNYLGMWCLAEGAIFDFFDRKIHVVKRPPVAAEYWVAGIDYGTVNAFCCLLIGVNTGKTTQTGKKMWVEKEYYWDPKKQGKQKTNSEFAEDVKEFLEDYFVKGIYLDPSAEAFQLELKRKGMHVMHANNDVENGIQIMTSEMKKGNIVICQECSNTIREIESYVWDNKSAVKGWDEPVKKDDHACLVGDTLITVKPHPGIHKKTKISIKELAEFVKKKGKLYNYNPFRNCIESDEYLNVCLTRENAEIFELELEDGKILRATGDHQILTQRGYIELQQLTLSDIVMTCNIKYTSEESST